MALLTKVNIFGFAKTVAMFYLIFGVIFVILQLILKAFSIGLIANTTWGMALLTDLMLVIMMPIFGFIAGLIIGLFINWALKTSGGIDLKLE